MVKLAYEDHPRVCGEKENVTGSVQEELGSPPRVRGKVISDRFLLFCLRITPACAGKSAFFRPSGIYYKDHPRVCGEKSNSGYNIDCNLGSPPRVRGKDAFIDL